MATYHIDIIHTTMLIKNSLPHWWKSELTQSFGWCLVQVSSFKNGTSILLGIDLTEMFISAIRFISNELYAKC